MEGLVHLVSRFVSSNNMMRVNANSKAPLVRGKLQTKSTSKIKLSFNQILISRSEVMLSSNKVVVTCATIGNKEGSISNAKLQRNV